MTARRRGSNREQRTEGDRHLTENVAGLPLPDHAVDPVYELDGLDTTIKEREQRPLVALISGVLTQGEADVRRRPVQEPLPSARIETRENRHLPDLVRRHHWLNPITLLPKRHLAAPRLAGLLRSG